MNGRHRRSADCFHTSTVCRCLAPAIAPRLLQRSRRVLTVSRHTCIGPCRAFSCINTKSRRCSSWRRWRSRAPWRLPAPMTRCRLPPSRPCRRRRETVYAPARPRMLQMRTVVEAAGRQSVIGSGFIVGADGLAITNYHVVSQYALEPKTSGSNTPWPTARTGKLDLHGDRCRQRSRPWCGSTGRDPAISSFADAARSTAALHKGERLFSMGNPLDLGFTIVEGTYNGLVERIYNQRLHFSRRAQSRHERRAAGQRRRQGGRHQCRAACSAASW